MTKNISGMRVALHNLGCKVNGYEMEVMEQRLIAAGCNIVPFNEKADIYIINTCTVTNIADRKSRQMLHRAKKENPEATVVAVGCYVETGMDGVKKDECIDLAVGNNKKGEIVEILEEFYEARNDASFSPEKGAATGQQFDKNDKTLGGHSVIDINKTHDYEDMKLTALPEHTRAYIKIQDGCNQFCTYCVIPYARGRVRSRNTEDIISEAEHLASLGCKEVVITGIHVGAYGIDRGEPELIDLLERMDEIKGIERIRLGSVEPRLINEENVKRLSSLKKLCPHFHLSLQSGSDGVLKRMNRHYTAEEFRNSVELLRKAFDKPAITTDVIVGFPGETDEEFDECRRFVEDIGFYEMHVFKYSPRKGTVAASMPGQLTDRQKSVRSSVLLDITKKASAEYRKNFIGKEIGVLFEDEEEIDGARYMVGHTDRYVRVAAPVISDAPIKPESGQLLQVTPKGMLTPDTLII